MLKSFLLPLSHSEDTLSLRPAVPIPSSKSQYMSMATVLVWQWTEVPGVSDSSCKKHWYNHPLLTEVQFLNDHKAICPETGSSSDSIVLRKCCVYEHLFPGSKESTLTKSVYWDTQYIALHSLVRNWIGLGLNARPHNFYMHSLLFWPESLPKADRKINK